MKCLVICSFSKLLDVTRPSEESSMWLYGSMAKYFSHWLPAKQQKMLAESGGYSFKVKNTRVIFVCLHSISVLLYCRSDQDWRSCQWTAITVTTWISGYYYSQETQQDTWHGWCQNSGRRRWQEARCSSSLTSRLAPAVVWRPGHISTAE